MTTFNRPKQGNLSKIKYHLPNHNPHSSVTINRSTTKSSLPTQKKQSFIQSSLYNNDEPSFEIIGIC